MVSPQSGLSLTYHASNRNKLPYSERKATTAAIKAYTVRRFPFDLFSSCSSALTQSPAQIEGIHEVKVATPRSRFSWHPGPPGPVCTCKPLRCELHASPRLLRIAPKWKQAWKRLSSVLRGVRTTRGSKPSYQSGDMPQPHVQASLTLSTPTTTPFIAL